MEKFGFNPEEAAFRVELVGNLKIDPVSPESKRLLQEWVILGENRLGMGSDRERLAWNREQVEMYLEAELFEEAAYTLKAALYNAEQMNFPEEAAYFRQKLIDLGENPDVDDSDFTA